MTIQREDVVDHFVARARTYDRSSSWCTDDALGGLILTMAQPGAGDQVLDVACGTGLVSKLFTGRVARVVGVDVTTDMAAHAEQLVDELVIAPAESLPFADDTFDVVVCRQGIQFMTLPDAVDEMVRVLRPGGRIVLINLCAYGAGDRDEYFEVLRLRNPVRRHFFLPDQIGDLLTTAGCVSVETERYVSVEDVDVWSDNGAITEDSREAIRQVYRNGSADFLQLHAVGRAEDRIVDQMLFVLAAGRKPEGGPVLAELSTKLLADVRAAFIAESMNVQRYSYFAEVAEIEGHAEAAQLLRDLAASTACVAHGHFDFLHFATDPATDRLIGDTRSQVGAALAGESKEANEFYPRLKGHALADGSADVASWMETLSALKRAHVTKLEQALAQLNESCGLAG